jgi:outer membrane lipoprotein SlyB
MPESQSRTNPIVVIAAVAVIIFSAVGVGVMTGVIPSSFSKNSDTQVVVKEDAPKAAATATAPIPPVTEHKTKKAPVSESAKRQANEPVRVASAPRTCANCGRVEAVNAIEEKGEGSGLGAVAGGVVGGLLGNQIGAGRGRTVATVAGAGAGAYAGHEVEKNMKKTLRYDIVVRLEDGNARTFSYKTEPAFRTGDKVKIVDGALVTN